jgi:hypothetical protein
MKILEGFSSYAPLTACVDSDLVFAALEELNEANLLLHVIGARPNWEEQRTNQVVAEFENPQLHVVAKGALPAL